MLLLMPLQFGYFIYAHREFKNEDPDYKYFFEGYQKLFPIIQLYIFNIFVFLIFFMLFYVPFSKSPDFATLQQLSMLDPKLLAEGKVQIPQFTMQTKLLLALFFLLVLVYTIMTSFASYLLWFQKLNPVQAIITSIRLIKMKYVNWVVFTSLLMALNFIGMLFFGIGIIITIPISLLSIYVAYEDVVGSETELA